MPDTLLIAGTFVLAIVATLVLVVVRRRLDRSYETRVDSLEERLAETHSVDRTHLERPPTIRDLAVVDRTDDGRPVYVPIVRIDLGMTEAPSMDLVFEFAASTLEAIHPVLEADPDVRVRHYDIQFTFGPSGLFVSRLCQRVSVPFELADSYCADPQFSVYNLGRMLEKRDDGTDDSAIVWGPCHVTYERSR
ncbi:hypothetical protein OB919_01910 [Halobacteria archaeon AArc-curdl1]|uniref:Uncharacterized protein n=1 Tax=Natronosalvus hydrolyticus TaxID=2979988 RepID=A0AAP3E5U9_9EURY|nr:hypothetical protein [Halobacteria archaeon AArc-curdl1]